MADADSDYPPVTDLREKLNRRKQQENGDNGPSPPPPGPNDLRHRLNQRSRPFQSAEEGDDENRGRGGRNNGGRGGGRGGGRRRGGGGGGHNNHQDERDYPEEPRNGYQHDDRFDDPPPPAQQQERRPDNRGNNNRRGGGGGDRRNHSRIQGRGGAFAGAGGDRRPLPKPKRNTENFNPSHVPCEMRILAASPGLKRYDKEYTSRDVLVVRDLFGDEKDLTIYEKLLHEIENSGIDSDKLWQSWHGDSHVIADDKRNWKKTCPTFHMILDKLRDYFGMHIEATRLNWYRDSNEWKPFHHDAAAIKADKARTQNFTAAVSFGMEREAAFEHAQTKTQISMPQPNGTIYTFGKDVNILWRHGILQCPPEKYSQQGRISIIAWGWIEQTQV